MPRTPKRDDEMEDFPLDEEAVQAAIAEVEEDLVVEEVAAAFFAAEKSDDTEEEAESGEAEVDEGSAEPILAGEDGVSDGGSADESGEEGEADSGSADEESARTEEPSQAEEDPAVVDVDALIDHTKTAAERRPTTAGGLTVLTS